MCAESVLVAVLMLTPIPPVPAPRDEVVRGPYKGLAQIEAPPLDPTALCKAWCVQHIDGWWRLRYFGQYRWHPGVLETISWELAPDVDVSEWQDEPCRLRSSRPRHLQVKW